MGPAEAQFIEDAFEHLRQWWTLGRGLVCDLLIIIWAYLWALG